MSTARYFEAIRLGDTEALRALLDGDASLLEARAAPEYDPERPADCTGLHAAVYAGRLAIARELIERGIDLEAETLEGRSALHDSIEFGQAEITELLLASGAEVDVCSAAILGRLDRLCELLDGDAALVNDRSTRLSPLAWAAFGNQVEAAGELIGRGARMDDGELLCAASVGHVEVGRLLIEHGADPSAVFGDAGANALHAAAGMKYGRDSRPFVAMLLVAGVDVSIRDRQGRTARQIAEEKAAEGGEKPFDAIAEMLGGGATHSS